VEGALHPEPRHWGLRRHTGVEEQTANQTVHGTRGGSACVMWGQCHCNVRAAAAPPRAVFPPPKTGVGAHNAWCQMTAGRGFSGAPPRMHTRGNRRCRRDTEREGFGGGASESRRATGPSLQCHRRAPCGIET